MNANLLTIGTEITSGEVVNSNAAWISTQLENLNVRVVRHLTVRDQSEEMLNALRFLKGSRDSLLFVTGGLGPTTDDVTREILAQFVGAELEFDDQVYADLKSLYEQRGLPLREAHRHQCWFPKGSARLKNPVGTALGFYIKGSPEIFVLPGPPRELEGMWNLEVMPRLQAVVPKSAMSWHRWTYFGVPESEVAEIVEKVIENQNLEVGYRAQVPFVRVKLFADASRHADLLAKMDQLLLDSLVGRGHVDLAELFLEVWPDSVLRLADDLSESHLAERLYMARRRLLRAQKSAPQILFKDFSDLESGLGLFVKDDGFLVRAQAPQFQFSKSSILPYKTPILSDRGRKAAAEWALWLTYGALKNHRPKSSI